MAFFFFFSCSFGNRYTMMTDALSNVTYLTYNKRLQMTQVKDALNQEYNFTYDPLGLQKR